MQKNSKEVASKAKKDEKPAGPQRKGKHNTANSSY
jgi:hypothetical protein